MEHAYQNRAADLPWSAIDSLRAEGVAHDDIRMALDLQAQQRAAGVPVLPLRVICGLEPRRTSAARLLATPTKPRVAKGGIHITRRPVWAGSVQTGSAEEHCFARPLSATMRKMIANACYRTFKQAKELAREARTGTRSLTAEEQKLIGFTTSCRDILLKLLDDEKFRKGWCVPAYETIMRWTGLSRSTVHRSLRALADLGFIEWVRRFIYTKDRDFGARSEQTSNLYRITLPAWLSKLLGLQAPTPDDHAHRLDTAQEEYATMLAQLPPGQRARQMPSNLSERATLISAALRTSLRHSLPATGRECQTWTAPHPNSFITKKGKAESA
ncbi:MULTISPECIES: helix-turn-helix domain-containing protein [unclassified Novosphingobium]|uniref:helix-turn-helix domain-containing protein n=1 Tax=unclassified Novosphingobium TaxID=2644732 RepID=UPI00146CC53E|nr:MULTISPECIES: helix-turn-helix domain-containing protein [unclassified Novosphingobium]NMN07560.1 hypothetical protein [Novosphingobium sp. SG919]NMN89837.1 hypothetical protein [Novosphingobium sp. SG916]